jgi:DNA polymerase I
MINIDRVISNDPDLQDSFLIVQVHDELIYEVPRAHARKMAHIMREQMENAVQLTLKLTVDVYFLFVIQRSHS